METFKVGARVVCHRDVIRVAGTVTGVEHAKYSVSWDDGNQGEYYLYDLYKCR
jgi:hypothetical protein